MNWHLLLAGVAAPVRKYPGAQATQAVPLLYSPGSLQDNQTRNGPFLQVELTSQQIASGTTAGQEFAFPRTKPDKMSILAHQCSPPQ